MFSRLIPVQIVQTGLQERLLGAVKRQLVEQRNELKPSLPPEALSLRLLQEIAYMKLKLRGEEISVYKLIAHYELDPIELEGNGSFSYAIDVYRDLSGKEQYFPRVYRREFYRLNPSFSSCTEDGEKEESDEELLVEDMARSWSENRVGSPEEVIQFVLREIEYMFDISMEKGRKGEEGDATH